MPQTECFPSSFLAHGSEGWKSQIWVCRAMLAPQALRRGLFQTSPLASGSSLACEHTTPTFMSPSPCVHACVQISPLHRDSPTGLGAILLFQYDLILTNYIRSHSEVLGAGTSTYEFGEDTVQA